MSTRDNRVGEWVSDLVCGICLGGLIGLFIAKASDFDTDMIFYKQGYL